MRVKIDDFVLGDRGMEGPSQFRISAQRSVQDVNPIRADYAQFIDRGNKSKRITFGVVKEHDSYGEAEAYMLDHDRVVPSQGLLTFECPKGSGVIKRYVQNAVIESLECWHIGVSTFHTYSILAGEILDKKPSGPAPILGF